MLAKWHLGHMSPRHLPTARGFDSFTGYLAGKNYYWSKRYPNNKKFYDFMEADKDCYSAYVGDDKHDYSTFFYRDHAVSIIQEHDTSDPLFLYLSFQAVHDPFVDNNNYLSGIPKSYLEGIISDNNKTMYDRIISDVKGRKRRQYAMSLVLLDEAVESVHDALVEREMLDNSFIIFASDNGGCYGSGGKNGPLRGTKGTLFEGGGPSRLLYLLTHARGKGTRHRVYGDVPRL